MQLARLLLSSRSHIRLYWPWLMGVALLFSALVIHILEFPVLNTKNVSLEKRTRLLEAEIRQPVELTPKAHVQNPTEQLAKFARVSIVTSDLQSVAAKNGLVLIDANYKPVDEIADADIGRMEIVSHVKGTYLALKTTIANMLAAHEGLALDSISIRRNHSTDVILEIELHFSFFYRKQA